MPGVEADKQCVKMRLYLEHNWVSGNIPLKHAGFFT